MKPLFGIVDSTGLYGYLLHYAIAFFFVGSAFLIFIYLWKKKRLDMDEDAKFQMMQTEEIDHEK